jgi:hypothetical protein
VHRPLADLAVEAVDVQLSIEVVALVLKAARQQVVA